MNLEEARAILIDYGILGKLNESPYVYHGRAGDGSKFSIDPEFCNSSESKLKQYTNVLPTFYLTNKENAVKYAKVALEINKNKSLVEELHIIKSFDNSALYFSPVSFYEMKKDDEKRAKDAFRVFVDENLKNPSRFLGLEMHEKEAYFKALKRHEEIIKKFNLFNDCIDIEELVQVLDNFEIQHVPKMEIEITLELLLQKSTAVLLKEYPKALINGLLKGEEMVHHRRTSDNKGILTPISRQFLWRFFDYNNIIGVRQDVFSEIICEALLYQVAIFKHYKINTKPMLDEKINNLHNFYSPISNIMAKTSEKLNKFGLNTSSQVAIRNFRLLNKELEYAFSLNNDAGVCVGDQAKTVLDIYQRSYYLTNQTNPQLLGFMNTLMLFDEVHKGVSDFSNDDFTNLLLISCQSLDAREKEFNFLYDIINTSQEYTKDFYINNHKRALNKLHNSCAEMLSDFNDKTPNESEVAGLEGICRMLQTCQSASFSGFAKINDTKLGDLVYFLPCDKFAKKFSTSGEQIRFKQDISDPIFGFDRGV